eukprot:m.134318 g.134318  ORF g.134318 m.134318 type:complete len:77 (-) comp13112_c9_seq6:68-298(-)
MIAFIEWDLPFVHKGINRKGFVSVVKWQLSHTHTTETSLPRWKKLCNCSVLAAHLLLSPLRRLLKLVLLFFFHFNI